MSNLETSKPIATKSTPLGKKIWLSAILFGLVGQIAWVIENMYFATFAQNIFQDTAKFGNMYYIATTLMVIFSAIAATVTTIFAGGLCDKIGKRKPFITYGYIIWGITIMLFAAIPINFSAEKSAGIVAMLVIFDCVMTFFGSTANDAAFNTWVADVSNVSNRGKLNAALSVLPIFATVIGIVIAMFTFDKGAPNTETGYEGNPFMYKLFFIIVGIIPIISGLVSIFLLQDSPEIVKNSNPGYLKETFYGFRINVIKENKMMYITLTATCILGIAQQVFMSYLFNFIIKTLGIENYIIPVAVIVVVGAIITAITGILMDKYGRKHVYIPTLLIVVIGAMIVYCMKFMPKDTNLYLGILIGGGIPLMGCILALGSALSSSFQDYIPKGYEGRFQGVRMLFTVLIPMIIGPIISLIIGINSFDSNDAVITSPPFEIFLAAGVVAIIAIIPLIFVRKDADRLRTELLAKRDQAENIEIAKSVEE